MTPSEPEPEGGAAIFMRLVREHLDAIAATQKTSILEAARLCREAIRRDGMIWLFGTGHSHLLAIEGHHRAGGLACVCPVLGPGLMMHEGADLGTRMERLPGLAAIVLDHYPMRAGDVLFVFSNSGINAVPVEAALHGKARGLSVVAVQAEAYARGLKPGPAGRKLGDIADLVIDNQGPPGDALVRVQGELRTGPGSTVSGAFILGAILSETVLGLAAEGIDPPVYISSNMPGAEEHNARLVARYRPRNPHL
jgi:uncharacterized phosphosugar-binding protein